MPGSTAASRRARRIDRAVNADAFVGAVISLGLVLLCAGSSGAANLKQTTRPASRTVDILFTRHARAGGADLEFRGAVRPTTRVLWTRDDGTRVVAQCELLEVTKAKMNAADLEATVIYRAFFDLDGAPAPVSAADVTVDGETGTVYLACARGADFWITSFDMDAVPVDINGRVQLAERLPPDASKEELDAAMKRSADRHFRTVARHRAQKFPPDPIEAISIEKDGDALVVKVTRRDEPVPQEHVFSRN